MNICFIFDGIPHYHVHLLNEINRHHLVTVIMPKSKDFFKDQHVMESEEGDFQRYFVEKKKTIYGKSKLVGFRKAIQEIRPNIVVFIWPYFLELVFNPFLTMYLKSKSIKIGIKEIPFFVPTYHESQKEFKSRTVDSMLHERVLHNKLLFTIQKRVRQVLYSRIADFSLNYIEDGKKVISSYGLSEDRIFVTYNSDNTDAMFSAIAELKKGRNYEKNPYKLTHIGRLVKWKRVDLLIQAVAELVSKYPKIHVDIIGNGPEMDSLKKLSVDLNIEEQVHFLGPIYDKREIGKVFLTTAIYVLAGMGGLSLNEAMAYGLPVVCSVCDGTEKHLVYEGVTGRYFLHDDLSSLVSVLDDMLAKPQTLIEMGENATKLIREKINEHAVVDAYLHAFKEVESR